ncbi:hypothetical protein CWB81_15215 [Pseudoalteromonas sp. S1688]|nr:hypothetical protein B1F84_06780 [Pseudoalteromonas sp. DL-6]TMP49181.1 hypothetical protein CWB81_15215 [Pseudoalteromonas sp. S1688]
MKTFTAHILLTFCMTMLMLLAWNFTMNNLQEDIVFFSSLVVIFIYLNYLSCLKTEENKPIK